MIALRPLAGLALITCLAVASASAQEQPQDDTILTVTAAGGDSIELSRADLAAMGSVTITTTTIWTEGDQQFEGLPLDVFLRELELEGSALRAHAINDYVVEIPVEDAVEGGPIIAYAQNGAPMSVRDNGPLWIVYPYDSRPEYQSEVIYARSIWQLDRIDLLP
jgi:hypothetical protein